MVSGYINDRYEAIVPLRILGSDQLSLRVNAIVDTGFSGTLIIPQQIAMDLNLSPHSKTFAKLADDVEHELTTYRIQVEWNNRTIPVTAMELGNKVLIGMQLLVDHRMMIDIYCGGKVKISTIKS